MITSVRPFSIFQRKQTYKKYSESSKSVFIFSEQAVFLSERGNFFLIDYQHITNNIKNISLYFEKPLFIQNVVLSLNMQMAQNMKAIIENKNTYKITGERGDFFITEDNRGKVKMFAKHLVEVVEIDAMPKVKKYSQGRVPSDAAHAAFRAKFNMSQLQDQYTDSQIKAFKNSGKLNSDNTFKN